MAGTFSTRKALRLLAASVAEKMPYIANSESLFPQSEMKGKKFGMAVHGYLPDAGSVSDGLVAKPDKAHQVEVTAYVNSYSMVVFSVCVRTYCPVWTTDFDLSILTDYIVITNSCPT